MAKRIKLIRVKDFNGSTQLTIAPNFLGKAERDHLSRCLREANAIGGSVHITYWD